MRRLRFAVLLGIALGLLGLAALAQTNAAPCADACTAAPPHSNSSRDSLGQFLAGLERGDEPPGYRAQSNRDLQRVAYADPLAALLLAGRWRRTNTRVARELVVGAAIALDDPRPLAWWMAGVQPLPHSGALARHFHHYRLATLAVRLGAEHISPAPHAAALRAGNLATAEWQRLRRAVAADSQRLALRRDR